MWTNVLVISNALLSRIEESRVENEIMKSERKGRRLEKTAMLIQFEIVLARIGDQNTSYNVRKKEQREKNGISRWHH